MNTQSAFSSCSVDDLAKAKQFYSETLGLTVTEIPEGLQLQLPGGGSHFIYPKGSEHTPATFTVLNFLVDDVEQTVDQLTEKGVTFEQYSGEHMTTNEKGVVQEPGKTRAMAWFKDPAGNIISVLHD